MITDKFSAAGTALAELGSMTAVALTAGLALVLASVAVSGPPARAALPAASFGRAIKLSPPLNSSRLADAFGFALSCSSLGNCAAAGTYNDRSNHFQAMVIPERSGRWSHGVKLRLPRDEPANVEARVSGIACTHVGNCTAVGDYRKYNADLGRVFAASEVGGQWQQATELRLPAGAESPPVAQVNAISCPARGSCVAVGSYADSTGNYQSMLVTERAGRWRRAIEVYPTSNAAPNPDASLGAIACQPPGQCVMAGQYADAAGGRDALGLVWSHGTFLAVQQIKLPANSDRSWLETNSVSCQGSGQCVIVGAYRLTSGHIQAMASVESGRAFSRAAEIKAVPPNDTTGVLYAVSCTATGPCVAVGEFTDTTNHEHAYAVLRSATGHWGHAAVVQSPPGTSPYPAQVNLLDGISCFSRGCTAAGFYITANDAHDVMVATER